MKTKTELEKMSVAELRKEASGKVPNYGKMDKTVLIAALLKTAEPEDKPDEFTDVHGQLIEVTNKVRVKIGNKKPEGVITQLKRISDDEYAYVILDGTDKAKMFHTNDIEYVGKGEAPAPEKKSAGTIMRDANGKAMGFVAAPEDDEETGKPAKPAAEKPKATKEKVTKEKGNLTVGGFKATKYDEHLKGIDLNGIKHDDTVKFTVKKKGSPDELELVGKVKSLIWDTNIKDENKATFLIKVEGDKTMYFKRIGNVTKA